tara:strand:- start:89 stop:1711 length:1623 start_codon:yes stop_codon:yes gene_type:complete
MSRYNMNVLADAKEEYTRQLVSVLSPEIYVGIKSIYDAAQNHCNKINDKSVLKKFQLLLSSVPQWNQNKVEEEFKRIVKKTDCDFIEDLITAVFVSHTKVLSSIKLKKNNKTIPVNVPVGSFFIHKCYIECARNFWRKSWLLDNTASSIDIQRNMADSERLIQESIKETIRKLLPVRYILKEYIDQDFTDDEITDNIEESLSQTTKNNLRKLVRNEIQTLSKSSFDDNYSTLEIPDEMPGQIESPKLKDSLFETNETPETNETHKTPETNETHETHETHEKEAQTIETHTELASENKSETNLDVPQIESSVINEEDYHENNSNTTEQLGGDNKIVTLDKSESLAQDTVESENNINEKVVSEEVIEPKMEENLDKNIKIINSDDTTPENTQMDTKANEIIIEKIQTVAEDGNIKSQDSVVENVVSNQEENESYLKDGTVDDKISSLENTTVRETINLDNQENDKMDIESSKVYDNLNDYNILDDDAKVLKDKVAQEDIEHLETLSNKKAIKELKENIENSHKEENVNDDEFSFFNDAVRFQ